MNTSIVESKVFAWAEQKEEEVVQQLPKFLQRIQDCISPIMSQTDKIENLRKRVETIPHDQVMKFRDRLKVLEDHALKACDFFKPLAEDNVRLAHTIEQTSRYYTQLYQAAEKVLEVTKDFVPEESEERAALRASLQRLETVMKNHIDNDNNVVEVEESKGKIAPNPHVLPQTEKLLTDLEGLYASLQTISKDIANPEVETKIPELKKALIGKVEAFDNFVATTDSLSKPIARKLKGLGQKIEAYNEQKIPEEHLKSIALYERSTKKGIVKELRRREAVHEHRLVQHDKLAETWALCLIKKEVIADKLWHIDKYTSTQADVVKLAQKLGELSKIIGDLKEYLRSQKNPETKLEKAKSDFKGIQTTYGQLKTLEKQYKDDVDKLIKKDLPEVIEKGSMPLKERIKALVIFNPSGKEDIGKELSCAVKAISEEQQFVLQSMTKAWESVQKMLYDEFKREINRLGFSIFENSGQIPYDWTYTIGMRKPIKDYTGEKENEEIETVKEKKESILKT